MSEGFRSSKPGIPALGCRRAFTGTMRAAGRQRMVAFRARFSPGNNRDFGNLGARRELLVRTVYAEERLHLLRRLRVEAQGAPLVDVFRPAAETLRYRLGTSLADLKIPFRVGDVLRQITHAATVDAYLLSGHRHKSGLPRGEHDKLMVVDGFDPAALRSLSFSPPSSVTREAVKRAFTDAIETHAGVDAGLVASFLGTERPGRQWVVALHSVLTKARTEAARSDTGEPTLWLASLMLRALAEQSFEFTKNGPLGEPMSRFVRASVASLLHAASALALRETGVSREAGLPFLQMTPSPTAPDPAEARVALLACAGLGLLPFLGQRANVGQTGIQAYGVCFDRTPRRLEDAVARLARGEDPEALTREIALSFTRNPEERRRAERAAALSSVRANARVLARQLELVRGNVFQFPPDGSLAQFLLGRESVEQVFANEHRRRELARVAREAARSAGSEIARQRLEALALAARELRDDEPAGWLGAAEARHHAAHAIVALAADTLLDRLAGQAGQLLLERTGQETEGGEALEYERGRLYLLSHEEQPLLAARMSAPQVGHLFVDVKDFTRRTAFLKESVIADFLQREFYSPILAAASGADPGARQPMVPRAITLNNLLGDALSFSGDIVVLMKLAREIRAALRSYARRLEQEASQEAIAQRVRELESTHRLRREAMERSIRELVARAPYADPSTAEAMLARARQTRAELARQELLFRGELARATGERLEAGIFVSFGTAAEVARFEDPFFGALKVAIAEKINESARGTARNPGVREKLEALRSRASRQAGHELELPFSVFVDVPPSLPVSAEQALAVSELSARGDVESAERLLVEIARAALVRLEHSREQTGGEIYNAGAAISEEALTSYLEARGDELVVHRRELRVTEMHPFLRERFFFPTQELSLVVCLHPANRALSELFVHQGRAHFKGFEATGGLGVYEIVDPAEPFFQLLAQHHVPGWGGRELTPRSPGSAA